MLSTPPSAAVERAGYARIESAVNHDTATATTTVPCVAVTKKGGIFLLAFLHHNLQVVSPSNQNANPFAAILTSTSHATANSSMKTSTPPPTLILAKYRQLIFFNSCITTMMT